MESKVKNYIAALPPPNTSARRKTFKKHTSMPGYIGDCGLSHSEASITSCIRLEQEYNDYRRQSEHTITELEKQVQIAVTMITQANNENFDLMDRIDGLEKVCRIYKATPEPTELAVAKLVCTPKKPLPPTVPSRFLSDDTTGSFIGQSVPRDDPISTLHPPQSSSTSTTPHSSTVRGKRNLSFNSSGDVTRRSGGTDSGINTSDGNDIQETGVLLMGGGSADDPDDNPRPRKRKRLRKCITRLLCCGGSSAAATVDATEAGPKFSYKKL